MNDLTCILRVRRALRCALGIWLEAPDAVVMKSAALVMLQAFVMYANDVTLSWLEQRGSPGDCNFQPVYPPTYQGVPMPQDELTGYDEVEQQAIVICTLHLLLNAFGCSAEKLRELVKNAVVSVMIQRELDGEVGGK